MALTRHDYESRQAELEALYRKLWPDLTNELGELGTDRHISMPFLIDLTAHSYPEAQTKLVVVGQQTNDWRPDSSTSSNDQVADLVKLYRDFKLGRDGYMSTFFQAAHQLYSIFNLQGPENGFIWTNLFKADEKNRRPKRDLQNILFCSFNVLPKEIELAAPDIVVFFTGPNYDDFLGATFPGVAFQRMPVNPTETERVLAKITNFRVHAVYPKAFRLYHPTALRFRKKWRLISDIPKLADADKATVA